MFPPRRTDVSHPNLLIGLEEGPFVASSTRPNLAYRELFDDGTSDGTPV